MDGWNDAMTTPASKAGTAVDLLPCPFCGEAPSLHPVEGGVPGAREFAIYCLSDKCAVAPYSRKVGADIASLAEQWNRRAAAPSTGDWLTVPREPTEEMQNAMYQAIVDGITINDDTHRSVRHGYRAMLAAAPAAPKAREDQK